MLIARAMLAYIFIVSGASYISHYADVAGYMQTNGVDSRLLPLVILTELGGGLLVLSRFHLASQRMLAVIPFSR
jgi:putative oxidoreductase